MRGKNRYYVTCGRGILLILCMLAGCGRDNPTAARTAPSTDATGVSSISTTDPCTIALVPHVGTDRLDGEIIRLQHEARHAMEPMVYVERLGWAFVAKARVSFDPGFYRLAEQCALCLTVQRPHSAEALLLHGHVLHNLHKFHEGEALARQLVAQRGLSFDYGLLGDVLMEQGKLTEAVAAYQQMIDLKPSPQAYSRVAHMRWLTGDLPGAIRVMHMAAGASGFRDPEAVAWVQVQLALYELQAGHMSKAADHIAAALAPQSDYAPALLARGRMLLAQGQYAGAVTSLTRATQLNPLPEYQWVLIEALRGTGRTDEARIVETQLLQHGAASDRRTFALYLATTGQDLQTALRLAEEELNVRADVFTLDTLAWACSVIGKSHEARTFSQRALVHGTQDARLFYHAGVIAAAAGQQDEAEHWFAQATALQQTLLPSEREQLAKASAALQSQISTLASRQSF